MKNAILIGMEFQSMLTVYENPACTDGYEGFFHLDSISGDVEETVMKDVYKRQASQRTEHWMEESTPWSHRYDL